MNIKPVEMQIAIPRTQDASQQQNQWMHKPMADQQLLAERSSRQAEEKLQKPNEVEGTPNARIEGEERDAEERGQSRKRNKGRGTAEDEGAERSASPQAKQAAHPYKGKHIDFSL